MDSALLIDVTCSLAGKISSVGLQTTAKSAGDVATSVASTSHGMAMYSSTTSENGNSFSIQNSVQTIPASFFPPPCSNASRMGAYYNISAAPCDIIQPCQNNGTCNNTDTSLRSYECLCASGINGTFCELNSRPCQLETCWNNGKCES